MSSEKSESTETSEQMVEARKVWRRPELRVLDIVGNTGGGNTVSTADFGTAIKS